jgi:hypothetical protein
MLFINSSATASGACLMASPLKDLAHKIEKIFELNKMNAKPPKNMIDPKHRSEKKLRF